MLNVVIESLKRYFANPEVAILWLFIIIVATLLAFFGKMLAPMLASIIIAYLLQGLVTRLERWHCPHKLAVVIVYLLFLGALVLAFLGLLPLLWRQLSNMVNELPNAIGHGQAFLQYLSEKYPNYLSVAQIQQLFDSFKTEIAHMGQFILSVSLASIPGIIVVIIYLVLVPLLVYFFLMDRKIIIQWLQRYLPTRRRLIDQVWEEVDTQIGNYVRGKVLEMFIVWIVCYATFAFMGLKYAMLLSVLVGVSVIIPYIGAVLVTVPVVVIAFLQWGWSSQFAYLVGVYALITALDGNVLVPLLFSGAVSLHPVAIIMAVLVFGGLWGFWGIFFAIPLAALVKAVLNALPKPVS